MLTPEVTKMHSYCTVYACPRKKSFQLASECVGRPLYHGFHRAECFMLLVQHARSTVY